MMKRRKSKKSWSITNRLVIVTSLVIAASGGISILVSQIAIGNLLDESLRRLMAEELSEPLAKINAGLGTLSSRSASGCCKNKDIQNLLDGIDVANRRILMIVGETKREALKGSLYPYGTEHLTELANSARKDGDMLIIKHEDTKLPVAAVAVKLDGGAHTGHLVYVRPVGNIDLLRRIESIWIGYILISLGLVGSTITGGLWLVLRPVRHLQRRIARIDWDDLDTSAIPTSGQPSEIKPVLDEMNRLIRQTQESSERQKIFAAALSHEFRTPATVISGFIQSVLNRPGMLGKEQIRALEIANKETLRMTKMLGDILSLSKSDSNQTKARSIAFKPYDYIQEAITEGSRMYDNRMAYVGEAAYENLLAIGDPDLFKQCLHNIIENASKYSQANSLIRIGLSAQEERVTISVADDGPGIATDQQKVIFERFKRAEGPVGREGTTSSGLGLAVVKMLMEAMGGSVGVVSKTGEGSIFYLILPSASNED